jgi:hypothetical protein
MPDSPEFCHACVTQACRSIYAREQRRKEADLAFVSHGSAAERSNRRRPRLALVGYGLEGQGEEEAGRAVAQIAWGACQRLDALQEAWRSLHEIVVRAK